ncbi:MAG TPA: hypothetical protein EYH05_01800 [Anaerolineae bacterium]|nr:hypothetical protein [Anaerolineae bacterium]
MDLLNLHDGDEVKTIVEGKTLRITPLEQFLALRGTLEDDQEFDAAMKFVDKAWQEWTILDTEKSRRLRGLSGFYSTEICVNSCNSCLFQ